MRVTKLLFLADVTLIVAFVDGSAVICFADIDGRTEAFRHLFGGAAKTAC